jgi:hypothetical protein
MHTKKRRERVMKKVTLFLMCALLMVCVAGMACAAQDLTGKTEVKGSLEWNNTGSSAVFGLGVELGKFMTPNWEPRIGLDFANVSAGGENITQWSITPSVSYNFTNVNTPGMLPYAGIGFSYVNTSAAGVNGGLGAVLYAGSRFFIGNSTDRAVFAEYRVTTKTGDIAESNGLSAGFLGLF